MSNTLHVCPRDDAAPHDTSTTDPDCVCGPTLEPVVRDDGSNGWLIVHHSLDGREQGRNEPRFRPGMRPGSDA